MDMALLADIRDRHRTAPRWAPSFARRGVLPESGGTWILPRLLGWAKAAEVAFRGRVLDAQESLEVGLVNEVVPHDELMTRTARTGRRDRRQRAALGAGDQAG